MKKFKYIALFILQLLLNQASFAQREKSDIRRNLLSVTHDSARVDCLNSLGGEYIWIQTDTAELFALQALEEARKINYIHGMAEALSLNATVAFNKYNNFPEAENLARQALLLYAKTPNKEKLNRTYYELGLALFAQSDFKEAINNLAISYDLSKKAGDSIYIFYSLTHAAYVYLESGNYTKAFENGMEMHQLVLKNNNPEWKFWESDLISALYASIGDFNTAILYARQLFQISKQDHLNLIGIAELFSRNQQFDSANYYYSLVADTSSNRRIARFYLVSKGEYYFSLGQYNKALSNFLKGLHYHKQVNDRNQVMRTLVDLAKTYDSVHNYTAAFNYAKEALALARQTGARQILRDSYRVLYSIYDQWKQKDSALFYHTQYAGIKDSIISGQVAAKLVAYSFSKQIDMLNKEKEIQQAHLQNESLVKKVLISGIALLVLLAVITLRNMALKRNNEKQQLEHEMALQKAESERTKAEFQQQAAGLQMQALRAQMNPHFIFNSLNSINDFILQNDRKQASAYLTKFSKLVRLILQNAQAAFISLESELEALELYLELEALRFDNHFSYKLNIDEDLDVLALKVPPLIIQPYVENAIWHGLMHKEERGHLEIKMVQHDAVLYCTITDDGIGRKKAMEFKSRAAATHQSMGMQITADRMAMLGQNDLVHACITIHDLTLPDGHSAGTEVILKIPVHYA